MSVRLAHLHTMDIKLHPHGVLVIAHNRPKKYNALNAEVYRHWLEAVQWAAQAEEAKVTVLTGHGKYFSSGKELNSDPPNETPEQLNLRSNVTRDLIRALAHFPKLIIAAPQGPAIGFGATALALCDVVYSVPEATFKTPFMQLGYCAEACSSITFPRIMGYSRANEMLLMGREFTATEMMECGFIARLYPTQEILFQQVMKMATDAAKFPPQAMKDTKRLIRAHDYDFMDEVNKREMDLLGVRQQSQESIDALAAFAKATEEKKRAKKAAAAKL